MESTYWVAERRQRPDSGFGAIGVARPAPRGLCVIRPDPWFLCIFRPDPIIWELC